MMGPTYIIGFLLLRGIAAEWTVDIAQDITVHMNHMVSVPFSIPKYNLLNSLKITFDTEHYDIAKASFQNEILHNETSFYGTVNITGVFLGRTNLLFSLEEYEVSAK